MIFAFAVAYSLDTTKGSGISQRPYGRGMSDLAHDRVAAQHLTRGTKA